MKSKSHLIFLVATVVTVSATGPATTRAAQPEQPDKKKRSGRDSEASTRREVHAVRELQRDVFEKIEFDERQGDVIKDLFEKHLEAIKEVMKEADESQKENQARLRELRDELTEAKRARDVQRIRDIRSEMRELDSGARKLRRIHREFDNQVVAELTPEQASLYRRLAAKHRRNVTPTRRALSELGRVHQVLKQMDLSEAQEKDVRVAMAKMSRAMAAGSDTEVREKAVADFRADVINILTDAQRVEFEEREIQYRKDQENRLISGKLDDE